MKPILCALAAMLVSIAAAAPAADPGAAIPLWPNGAPGSEARANEAEQAQDYWVKNVHRPSLTPFPADPHHRNGTAVVVIPGGGHRLIVWNSEGVLAAAALNRMGVSAFVLKYRLAREEGSTYTIEGTAAGDVRRAIRWVRAHAAEYGVDPKRVGIMGFSAGGELVSMVADNRAPAKGAVIDAVDRQSDRPDFQVLIYPGPLGVPANAVAAAPPAFITAGSIDPCCATPAVALYEQLRTAKVPAELHMFANTDHAFNMGQRSTSLAVSRWPDRLADWLADGGWLDAGSAPTTVAPEPAK